jgi:outer membrane protein
LRQRILFATVFVFLTVASIASAQSPVWRYGGRLSWVNADATSDVLGDTGSTLDLRSGLGAEFDATLMFSEKFGVEFSIGASAHRLQISDGDLGSIDAGRLWMVPLTAIGQFHLPVYGPWDPYIGLGITWAAPFYKESTEASTAGVEDMEFESELAIAAQIGVNYQVDNRWYANLDLRYSGATLEAQVRVDGANLPTVQLDAKPLIISLGFGYRF